MSWLGKAVEKRIERVVAEEIDKVLDRLLPTAIERSVTDLFASKPNEPLTECGFAWAFYIAMKSKWPDVDLRTASAWLWDYIDAPVGAPGYAWTPVAARDLAFSYIEEFGETRK